MDWWIGGLPRMARGSLCLTRSLLKFTYLACGTSPEAVWKGENEKETRKERERKKGESAVLLFSLSPSLPPPAPSPRCRWFDHFFFCHSFVFSVRSETPPFVLAFFDLALHLLCNSPSSSGTLSENSGPESAERRYRGSYPDGGGIRLTLNAWRLLTVSIRRGAKKHLRTFSLYRNHCRLYMDMGITMSGYRHVRVSSDRATVYPPYCDAWLQNAQLYDTFPINQTF